MMTLNRITQHPEVMGGKPCIRNMRVTVGMIVNQMAQGYSIDNILADYPYLEREDIMEALRYAGDISPDNSAALVISAVQKLTAELEKGALVTIDLNKTRSRILPLFG